MIHLDSMFPGIKRDSSSPILSYMPSAVAFHLSARSAFSEDLEDNQGDLRKCCPGGYHRNERRATRLPLANPAPPRHSSFSTVWLALNQHYDPLSKGTLSRDLDRGQPAPLLRHVAVKILVDDAGNESDILRQVELQPLPRLESRGVVSGIPQRVTGQTKIIPGRALPSRYLTSSRFMARTGR
jgi:hypothetical protein